MKRLLTSFYDTGVGDASLYSYIPVDFQASPSYTALTKIVAGAGALVIVVVIVVIGFIARRVMRVMRRYARNP